MFPTFFRDMVEGYLEALAFSEAPERYQASGPFDVSRFHFAKSTRERATDHVREFWHGVRHNNINLTEWADQAREVGHCIAYDRNGHGAGFLDGNLDGMSEATAEVLHALANAMGCTDTEFRKRGEAIHMRLGA